MPSSEPNHMFRVQMRVRLARVLLHPITLTSCSVILCVAQLLAITIYLQYAIRFAFGVSKIPLAPLANVVCQLENLFVHGGSAAIDAKCYSFVARQMERVLVYSGNKIVKRD